MTTLLTLLPATALVALFVFLARESLEFFRRRGSDRRKIAALTHLLARECELNYWTIKALRYIVIQIPSEENPEAQGTLSIERTSSGRAYARITSWDGGSESHHGIPQVHRDLMSKFLLDVATVDQKLFLVMEPAYDALAEIEHVRDSLLAAPEAPHFIGQKDYLEGFAGYAKDELNEAETRLQALYKHCTGKDLTQHRLR